MATFRLTGNSNEGFRLSINNKIASPLLTQEEVDDFSKQLSKTCNSLLEQRDAVGSFINGFCFLSKNNFGDKNYVKYWLLAETNPEKVYVSVIEDDKFGRVITEPDAEWRTMEELIAELILSFNLSLNQMKGEI